MISFTSKLKSVNYQQLKGDIFGGITAGVVALPLALAFGVQSGLGAEAGLYGAIILGFFAAAFGGTQTQISGPTGPITVLTGGLIAGLIQQLGSVESALPTIFFTFCLAGIFQCLLGLLKLGRYIRFVPYPVISGFMTGIGVIIILLQLLPGLGLKPTSGINNIFYELFHLKEAINYQSLLLCLFTIALIYILPKLTQAVPSSLVALIVMTIAAFYLKLDVPIIGDIPHGLPSLQTEIIDAFHIDLIYHAIWPALTIAAVGTLDSLLTSLIADNRTRTTHDSDQELIGQGIGNFLTSLFGGIPGAGATMRTVVNINSGGKTKLSGIIHSLLLLSVLVGLSNFAEYIPIAVLAGILFTVGVSIIDYKGLRHFFQIPRADALITAVVLVLTVFIGLLEAVVIGFIIASFATIRQVSEWSENTSEVFSAKDLPVRFNITKDISKNIYIKHLEGPLFFGFTSYFKQLTKAIPDIKYVIIKMDSVPYIDQSGVYALEDTCDYLKRKNIKVYFTGMNQQIKLLLSTTEVIPKIIPEKKIYSSFEKLIREKFTENT